MGNVIPFPLHKKKPLEDNRLRSLVFCVDCLKKACPDISQMEKGLIAMLIPIVDEQKRPFHAYVTIRVMDLKDIFKTATSRLVDIAEYATIRSIDEGFDPKSDFIADHFKDGNSEAVKTLH